MNPPTAEEKRIALFLAKVNKNGPLWNGTPCWEWIACIGDHGYGQFWDGKRLVKAHRWAFEYFNKRIIPLDLEPDHLCRNRKCVNPSHLELVTRSVNILRGDNPDVQRKRHAARTHCIHGHLFDKVNTYFRLNGGRSCRTCKRERMRLSYLKKRGVKIKYANVSN